MAFIVAHVKGLACVLHLLHRDVRPGRRTQRVTCRTRFLAFSMQRSSLYQVLQWVTEPTVSMYWGPLSSRSEPYASLGSTEQLRSTCRDSRCYALWPRSE
jgi:hypothetical protein